MGFAFLAHRYRFTDRRRFGGILLHHFGEVQHRRNWIWWVVTADQEILTALLLYVYDRIVKPGSRS